MKNKKTAIIAIFIVSLILILSSVIAWTPTSNINGRNFYTIFNFTNISAEEIYQDGQLVLTNESELNVNYSISSNSTTYWANISSTDEILSVGTLDDLTVTGNISTSSSFNGYLDWSWIQNKFITAVDNVWVYMSGSTLTFNSTKLADEYASKVYVINADIVINNSATDYANNLNASMSSYVEARDIIFNDSITSYIDVQDLVINTSATDYADNLDAYQNSSLTNYIDARDLIINESATDYADNKFIPLADESNLNVNSSVFWGVLDSLTDWFKQVGTSLGMNTTTLNATIDARNIIFNDSIKTYIDAQDLIINTSATDYTNNLNASMGIYVDLQDLVINTSATDYSNNLNASMSDYVEARDSVYNDSMAEYVNNNFIVLSNESNLNVNSSDYWDGLGVPSDLNYKILSEWDNISGVPTLLSNFTDDLGDRGYTLLSNFTDDLGTRGYTLLSNFTDDLDYSDKNVNSTVYWNGISSQSEITYIGTLDNLTVTNNISATWFNGFISWANIQNKFITAVGKYLFMDGTTLNLNTTELNTTIDSRVSAVSNLSTDGGIKLDGTTFSVLAGNGLEQETNGLKVADAGINDTLMQYKLGQNLTSSDSPEFTNIALTGTLNVATNTTFGNGWIIPQSSYGCFDASCNHYIFENSSGVLIIV